jgi:hypothetical protein
MRTEPRAIRVELIIGVIVLVVAVAYYAVTREPMLAVCLALAGLRGVII